MDSPPSMPSGPCFGSGPASAAERAWSRPGTLARGDDAVRGTLAAQRRAERASVATALPRLFKGLGTVPPPPWDETAATILLFLDGVALALAEGLPEDDVRAAYMLFGSGLIAAGQARRR